MDAPDRRNQRRRRAARQQVAQDRSVCGSTVCRVEHQAVHRDQHRHRREQRERAHRTRTRRRSERHTVGQHLGHNVRRMHRASSQPTGSRTASWLDVPAGRPHSANAALRRTSGPDPAASSLRQRRLGQLDHRSGMKCSVTGRYECRHLVKELTQPFCPRPQFATPASFLTDTAKCDFLLRHLRGRPLLFALPRSNARASGPTGLRNDVKRSGTPFTSGSFGRVFVVTPLHCIERLATPSCLLQRAFDHVGQGRVR